MIFVDTAIIVMLFILFSFSHSWLASNKIKKKIVENIGEKIAFYRLFYNLSSLIFFLFFYFLSPKPDVIVYDLHYPYDIITFAFQVLAIIGLWWSIKEADLKEFVGISQFVRYCQNEYDKNDLDEKQTLNIKGPFKYVRHPVYLFSIIFIGSRPIMTLFYFVTFICIVIYFYIGSFYEENKLIEKFGDDYKKYKKSVPRLIPFIKFL